MGCGPDPAADLVRHKGCMMIRPLLWLPFAVALIAGSAAMAEDDPLEKQVRKLHALAGGEYCQPISEYADPEDAMRRWTFSYQPSWSEDAEAEHVTLYRVWCTAGAYNTTYIFYMHRGFEGLMPYAFAEPRFEAKYKNDDGLDGALQSLVVTGLDAAITLTNPEFDAETLTISSHAYWRGIGDASSSGVWAFKDGEFSLIRYDIDASYDGEINPKTVLDYEASTTL